VELRVDRVRGDHQANRLFGSLFEREDPETRKSSADYGCHFFHVEIHQGRDEGTTERSLTYYSRPQIAPTPSARRNPATRPASVIHRTWDSLSYSPP
jgi:hypothetical protein